MKIKGLLITILCFTICSCGESPKDTIHLNGDVSLTVEAGSNYVDEGVTYPDKYTLRTTGIIDTDVLGTQELIYLIYSENGELVKEMHRFVEVKDTTSPIYTQLDNKEYYAGVTYQLNDLISYSDNFDSSIKIQSTKQTFNFTSPGENEVTFDLSDSSGNTTNVNVSINALFDFETLLNEVYKNTSTTVSKTTLPIGGEQIRATIDRNSSISYFTNTDSIHYIITTETLYGSRSSVQISAKYGEFYKAHISYHISGSGTTNYSVANATIDMTKDVATISNFSLMINDLSLDSNNVKIELEQNIVIAVAAFKEYFANTLHLDIK